MKKNICGSCLKFKTKECPHGTSAYMEASNPACSQHSLGQYVSGDDEPEAKPKAVKKDRSFSLLDSKPDAMGVGVITPEVLPPETHALAHSRIPELSLPSLFSPDQVTGQYRRAIAGTLEMLRFGAMLAEIEHDLNRGAPKGFIKTGDTMQAWLADNCPSVNYNTAMRFKRLAEGLKREFKIPAKMRLTDALPEADGSVNGTIWSGVAEASRDRVIEVRAEIWEFVNGKSARQLMFDFGLAERKPQGGSREGSGRPTVKNVTAQTRAGAAWAKIGHEIDLAQAWKFTRFLPIGIAREALDTVTLLRDSLKERLEEAKTGGSHVK